MSPRSLQGILYLLSIVGLLSLPTYAEWKSPGWVQVGKGVTTVQNTGTGTTYTLRDTNYAKLKAILHIKMVGGLEADTLGNIRFPTLTVKQNGTTLLDHKYNQESQSSFTPTITAEGNSITIRVSAPSIWEIHYDVFAPAPKLPEVTLQVP